MYCIVPFLIILQMPFYRFIFFFAVPSSGFLKVRLVAKALNFWKKYSLFLDVPTYLY